MIGSGDRGAPPGQGGNQRQRQIEEEGVAGEQQGIEDTRLQDLTIGRELVSAVPKLPVAIPASQRRERVKAGSFR